MNWGYPIGTPQNVCFAFDTQLSCSRFHLVKSEVWIVGWTQIGFTSRLFLLPQTNTDQKNCVGMFIPGTFWYVHVILFGHNFSQVSTTDLLSSFLTTCIHTYAKLACLSLSDTKCWLLVPWSMEQIDSSFCSSNHCRLYNWIRWIVRYFNVLYLILYVALNWYVYYPA